MFSAGDAGGVSSGAGEHKEDARAHGTACVEALTSLMVSTSPSLPSLTTAGPFCCWPAHEQRRKLDLLGSGNDFQLKDECSGKGKWRTGGLLKHSTAVFPVTLPVGEFKGLQGQAEGLRLKGVYF